jgi:hypothetical protein
VPAARPVVAQAGESSKDPAAAPDTGSQSTSGVPGKWSGELRGTPASPQAPRKTCRPRFSSLKKPAQAAASSGSPLQSSRSDAVVLGSSVCIDSPAFSRLAITSVHRRPVDHRPAERDPRVDNHHPRRQLLAAAERIERGAKPFESCSIRRKWAARGRGSRAVL